VTEAERRAFAELERRAARLEPELRAAILTAFTKLANRVPLSELERLIRAGDVAAVVELMLSDSTIARAFYGAYKVARQGIVSSGTATIRALPSDMKAGVIFDVLDPRVLTAVRTIQTGSLGFLQGEMRTALRQTVERGLLAGRNPRDIARTLPRVMGLTPYQNGVIANFQDALANGQYTKALTYELRDKRFDPILKRLRREKLQLSDAQIERMADSYRRRYKAYNAEVHARTAALESQRIGRQLAWQETESSGVLKGGVVLKTWRATLDSRTRPEHAAMNGDTVLLNQPYSNGDNWPGESNPWNCRCVETYRVRRA
jgi:Phage Mu protein F like protein